MSVLHYVVGDENRCHISMTFKSGSSVEYRVVEVEDDRLLIYTHGLSDQTFAAQSQLPEGARAAGHACDREIAIPFRPAI